MKFKLGEYQKLNIVRSTAFGAYLGDKYEQILLPKKQVPSDAKEGDDVEVFVYRDSEDRLIATVNTPYIILGECSVLKVKEVNRFGAYLDWGLEKDLFLPYKEQTTEVMTNDEVLCALYIDKSERLCATMKVYPYLKNTSSYEQNDMVTGTVYNINPEYGAFVAVDNMYHGLIQSREMTENLKIGDKVEARVKSIRTDGKIDLSLRKQAYLQIDDDCEIIVKELEKRGGNLGYGEKASPEVIRNDFAMSKSEFKRAIGRLLKQKRVEVSENDIILLK